MDDVDLVIAIPEGSEGDPIPVRRPAGAEIIAAIGETGNLFRIHVNEINVVVTIRAAVEGELCPIRRPAAAAAHIAQVRQLFDVRAI